MYFFLKTGKRYRPNSFFIVIYGKFVLGWTFFSFRSCPMTSLSYPVHVKLKIFEVEKICHVIHQSTPKGLQSSFLALFRGFRSVMSVKFMIFKKIIIGKIHGNRHGILITSPWRHRTCPEAEKILMLYKFDESYFTKRIRSLSLHSFSRKIRI